MATLWLDWTIFFPVLENSNQTLHNSTMENAPSFVLHTDTLLPWQIWIVEVSGQSIPNTTDMNGSSFMVKMYF